MEKKFFKQGSFTVEATVVMGMTLLALGLIIFLCSFVHGRACLTASAYEQAYTGREQTPAGLFGINNVEKNISFGADENIVELKCECAGGWSGFRQPIQVEAKRKKQKPVTFIRKIQAVKQSTG